MELHHLPVFTGATAWQHHRPTQFPLQSPRNTQNQTTISLKNDGTGGKHGGVLQFSTMESQKDVPPYTVPVMFHGNRGATPGQLAMASQESPSRYLGRAATEA